MTSLLVIIYAAFISLGLPDSVLGSAWPSIRTEMGAPLALAGYISMTVQAGTIVSSLMSNRLIARFGVGRVTFVSVLMTAAGLLGMAFEPNVWFMFLCAIPLGLGGGSVDAAINNFVALHYAAKHMSWLHCFWGIGATAGPLILSFRLAGGASWRSADGIISAIQVALVIILFFSLPLWKRAEKPANQDQKGEKQVYITNREALRLPLAKPVLLGFTLFCAVETTCGLWASSYLHEARGLTADQASMGASAFYAAITIGRLISGFATAKISGEKLIRIGQCVCIAGAILMMLPLPSTFALIGVFLIGLGTAPIYPNMLHLTPRRFGEQYSQAITGLEMSFAYVGSTLLTPLFGQIASLTKMNIYPCFLLFYTILMMTACEYTAKKLSGQKA